METKIQLETFIADLKAILLKEPENQTVKADLTAAKERLTNNKFEAEDSRGNPNPGGPGH